MRTLFLLLSVFLVGCSSIGRQSTFSRQSENRVGPLSGKAPVDSLGVVAFPPGSWFLEFQGGDTNKEYSWGNFFVFRRTGQQPHRLTIFRIPPGKAAPALHMYLDSLFETMGDGIPIQQHWPKEDPLQSGYPMRTEPHDPGNATEIDYSFMSKMQSGISWLTHARLSRLHDDWTFIIVYASTKVTSPEILDDVRHLSTFDRVLPAAKER